MASQQPVTWVGRSDTHYVYEVYSPSGNWNDVAGNYIFARQEPDGGWTALYIGETSSFRDRFSSHERWPCATRHGATHVHAHVNTGATARRAEETDLIAAGIPPCNG